MSSLSGQTHDWNGEAFISNVTLQDVLRVVRDYDCYNEVYHRTVVDSRAIATEWEDQFSMLADEHSSRRPRSTAPSAAKHPHS